MRELDRVIVILDREVPGWLNAFCLWEAEKAGKLSPAGIAAFRTWQRIALGGHVIIKLEEQKSAPQAQLCYDHAAKRIQRATGQH